MSNARVNRACNKAPIKFAKLIDFSYRNPRVYALVTLGPPGAFTVFPTSAMEVEAFTSIPLLGERSTGRCQY